MNRLARDGIVLSASVSCFNLYNIESQMKEVEEAGIKHIAGPGAPIRIHPGSSITIPHYLYHMFYADKNPGPLLCGEVSSVNDDYNDNFHNEQIEIVRFMVIDEDEEPLFLRCNEYGKFL